MFRDLRAWYLQPANQARLCDILPTNLQSPAEWVRRSRSAINTYSLADLRAWYLQPANQARLFDILPTNLQSPAEWVRRSRSATNTYSLADECDVYSLALLFDLYFQILSSTTSLHQINIQGTRIKIIGHVNSPRVKHVVAIKLLPNVDNVSLAVTHDTVEVPTSHQHGTHSTSFVASFTQQKTQTQRTT